MSAAPFMQLYVGDYLADTLHLTTEQHGAYLLLLMTMWRNGASLPNDTDKLARGCRVSPKRWPQIWSEISEFFTVDGGHIYSAHLTHWKLAAIHMMGRPAIPAAIKRDVHAEGACAYCGSTEGPFEIDHIFPWSRGGDNSRDNLTLACKPCNRSKRDKPVEEWKQ